MLSGGTCSACAIAGTAVLRMVVSKDSMKKPTASSRLAVVDKVFCSGSGNADLSGRKRRIDDVLRFADQPLQVRIVVKTFRVDLVDILRARRTRREPSAARNDFYAADRRVIGGRAGQNRIDRISGKLRDADLPLIQLAEFFLLRRGCRSI